MLGGTLLHAKTLNRHLEFRGYSDDGIYCTEAITRYYPSLVTVTSEDEAPPDATLVNEAVKLVPRGSGGLSPLIMSTYRNGIDMEVIEHIWKLDVQFGRWQKVSSPPKSLYKLNEQQEIVLQAIVQGCEPKEISQTLHVYGYYEELKLVKTHIGGYVCPGKTLKNYLGTIRKSSSQAGTTDNLIFT